MRQFRCLPVALLVATMTLAACGSGAAPASSVPVSKPASVSGLASPQSGASSAASGPASAAANAIAKPSGSQGLIPLTVSYSALIGTELPIWVAQEEGIFKKNGLDARVTYIASSKGIPALLAGQIQVADLGGSETLSAVAGGADLVTVAVDSPVYPFVFQVPASIKTVAELKGKKVGVSNFGSASDIAARVALKKEGLDPTNDVTILAVGSASNRIAAMTSGAIQGGVAFPPENLTLESKGFHTLIDLAKLKLPATIASSVVQRSYLTSHRDAVQKYVDSLVEAIAVMHKDKNTTMEVLQKYFKKSDQNALEVTYDFFVNSVIPTLPYPKPDQYGDAKAVLGQKDEAVAKYDVAKMLDDSFVKSAADRGLDKK